MLVLKKSVNYFLSARIRVAARTIYARFTNDHLPGTVSLPIVTMLQNLTIEMLKMAHRAGSVALRAQQLFVACFAPLTFLHYLGT